MEQGCSCCTSDPQSDLGLSRAPGPAQRPFLVEEFAQQVCNMTVPGKERISTSITHCFCIEKQLNASFPHVAVSFHSTCVAVRSPESKNNRLARASNSMAIPDVCLQKQQNTTLSFRTFRYSHLSRK